MDVVVVKYNAGNIYSVVNALMRLGITPYVTDDVERICCADKVILPGQGEAKTAMKYLRKYNLDNVVSGLKQPVLGICIGQQLMCRHSEENNTECLGIIDADVKRFLPMRHAEKVPAIGWNSIYDLKGKLFDGVENNEYVYFVHSYYVPICDATIAEANYIQPFSAALQKGNFYATQFHPEKSGDIGDVILQNFLKL